MRRPRDWLRQAELDLEAAGGAREGGHHEWACFAAQQGAEKAVKAVHESMGTEAWGHSVVGLLEGLGDVPPEVVEAAKDLDKHYIPARYPNAHPAGAPGDLYTDAEAGRAVQEASKVIDYARRRLSSA
ncbi:MAG: HEPN domain-containing protein [Actinomycetota bacterium]|nr:HEPN domain-containing protein [Actinomycetota bacterium]